MNLEFIRYRSGFLQLDDLILLDRKKNLFIIVHGQTTLINYIGVDLNSITMHVVSENISVTETAGDGTL